MSATLVALREQQVSPLGAALLVVYALIVGGAIGSFLNVVAYRLPLGMSLSHPGSRCPRCRRPIRWHHNVPVFGWLILRGRCRDCGVAISPRYPMVELLVAMAAALTTGLALLHLVDGDQSVYLVDLVGLVLRLVAVFLLFACALLEIDGNRLPLRALSVVCLVVLVAMLVLPELRPMSLLADPSALAIREFFFPLAAAALLALLLWPLLMLPAGSPLSDVLSRSLLVLLVALALGGLGLLAVVVLAAGLRVAGLTAASVWPPATRFGWAAALLAATLVWITVAGPSIGGNETASRGEVVIYVHDCWQTLMLAGLATALLTLLGRAVAAYRSRSSAPHHK